ncbi:hypothetical protein PCANC_02801 [Puccinia coronata f. sp. avenae]|uniref:Uncharacterized protein n=1 Tax=Puccinia coronata f. sp. avenae TaxID=200324 RepID=A0A2N5W4A3_9BASI|nr:hypothetical protein PCANC_02801 [Puccinia coronata f. sp. avenae]
MSSSKGGGKGPRKEPNNLASTGSSKSTGSAKTSSSQFKKEKNEGVAKTITKDDRVDWVQSQAIQSISQLQISPLVNSSQTIPGPTSDATHGACRPARMLLRADETQPPLASVSGMIHREMPSVSSQPEVRATNLGHRAKKPPKRKRILQEDRSSRENVSCSDPNHSQGRHPSPSVLISALLAKMNSRGPYTLVKPPPPHRSHHAFHSHKPSAPHRMTFLRPSDTGPSSSRKPHPQTASPSTHTKKSSSSSSNHRTSTSSSSKSMSTESS